LGIGEELFATVGAGVVAAALVDVVGVLAAVALAVAVAVGDASAVDTGAWPRATYTRAMNRTVTSTTTATNDALLMLVAAARPVPLRKELERREDRVELLL
jgi:steroid 5-alpha reductase family enzyme